MIATSSVITQTGAVESVFVGPIVGTSGTPLVGLTDISLSIFRASDKKFLDWSTMAFSATPTTLYQAMTELDSTQAPGIYYLDINTSSFVGTNADDHYMVAISQQGPGSAKNALQMGEFRIGTIVDKVEANLTASVASVPAALLATSTSGITGRTTVGGALVYLRKLASNKLVETDGDPGTLVLYDDDGVTVLETYQLLDVTGSAVVTPAGQPAQRSAASP
jgi:hypothetical protein